MYTVSIVNLRNSKCDFKCDRGTPVGNPYYMKNESMRDEVCDEYEEYFHVKVNDTSDNKFKEYMHWMLVFLKVHKAISLGCWCAPKRCHCDTIKEWLLEQVNKGE